MQKTVKKSGRPQQFAREVVLDKWLNLFWLQGYEATSISDLVKEAGINPPTLYASFGSKDEVFALVMERYMTRYLQPVMASIDEADLSVPARVERFLQRFIDVITQPNHPRGCMLLSALFVWHKQPSQTVSALNSSGKAFFTAFCHLIEQGIATGEIRAVGTPEETAIYILTFEKGLAMQAKAGVARETLYRISEHFVNSLCVKNGVAPQKSSADSG